MNRVTPATSELDERTSYDFYRPYAGCWNMENGERMAMIALLSMIKPACSIEIGTREGGSLAVISALYSVVKGTAVKASPVA